MDPQIIFDIMGYLASGITLISMLMANIIKLRIINSVGCFIFIVYAILISAYPIAVFNAIILIINVVYVIRLRKSQETIRLQK